MPSRYRAQLAALREQDLFRQTRCWARTSDGRLQDPSGRLYHDFSSNDYLGLSRHPVLVLAAQEAIAHYGVGSTGSRLITGTSPAHEECEQRIAEAKGSQAAVFFSTGMMTAHGVIKALYGKEDTIILDKLAHACLIDAARECGARIRVFPHNNTPRLARLLQSERARSETEGRILVIVESVYSMDGDLCPLAEIVALKEQYDAELLIDEAHGLGVLGPTGMGLAEELGLSSRIDLQMGTLGKAAGGAGGYIACSHEQRDLIVNKGRSLIFTTAPPPAQAAVATAALDLIASPEGRELQSQLDRNRQTLATLLDAPVPSAISPLILGENHAALSASQRLQSAGYITPAVRYPTVAKGAARLRLTLKATHTPEVITALHAELNSAL